MFGRCFAGINSHGLSLWINTPMLCMSLLPKILCGRQRIDLEVFPPADFITSLMQLPMMSTAEGDREFIADFQANAARLRKPKMMRVARLSSADKARLRCDELEMRFVTQPFGLSNGELALVDPI
jgi:hypothetical protein